MQIGKQTYPFTNEPPKEIKVPLSGFWDLRTIELSPIFQGSFEYTVDNTELTENSTTWGWTVTQSNAMAICTTSTTTWSKAILQSHVHARYKAWLGWLGRFTWLFTSWVANTSQWIWLADEVWSTSDFKNWFCIWYNGVNLSIARFQNDVMFAVPQSQWNDKLDWTWPSWMVIDPTKINVFEIRYQYLWGGAITFHVESSITGYFIEFHRILYANLNTSPSVYTPNYHFFVYANNKWTTSNLITKSASYWYFVEGKTKYTEIHQPQFSSGIVTKNTVTTEIALFTVKVKTTYAWKTNLIPILLELLWCSIEASSANNLWAIRLVKNATLGWVPVFNDINTNNSICSLDVAWTTVTWWIDFLDFQLAWKNDKINQELFDLDIILQDWDTVTVAVSSANSATFKWNLLWKELF